MMKDIVLPPATFPKSTDQDVSIADNNRERWCPALYFCSVGGFSVILTGLSINALTFFDFIENAKQINRIGAWLIAAAFPLAMFAAHAMDKLAEINRAGKQKAYDAEQKRKLYNME